MKLSILYDNRRLAAPFKAAWGFSCLIGTDLLFDTGGDFDTLCRNARAMKIDLGKIRHIVISHNHWDHTGGLWGLLKRHKGIRVYLCPRFGKALPDKIRRAGSIPITVQGWKTLRAGICLTAQMIGQHKGKPIAERSLVISSANRLVIITGCAHAGVMEIVRAVKTKFSGRKIAFLAGGLHLKDMNETQIRQTVKSLRASGVQRLMACHCTGAKALNVIQKVYGRNSRMIKAGNKIKVFIEGALCD